jgi:hypothetical protein
MENRNYILNEVREISRVVAEIGHQNPYTVPTGYFEGLAGELLQRIKADTITPVLPQTNNPYQVPHGYFEGLADKLLQRVKEKEPVLSTTLQQAKQATYEVPKGYFETLADKLLQRVKAEEISLSPALQQANNNPYQVPQGYFESLAGKLLQRVKEEEPILSTTLQQAKQGTYEVPQGYFDSLPAIILNRIKAEQTDSVNEELEILSPLLSQIGKRTPFSTPAGYFEELSENAVAGAQAIDFVNGALENLSPLMSSLKNKPVYEVPAGYFEQLPGEVLQAAKAQQPAKVVSISFTRRFIQYAAAAVVAGVIAVAGWMYMNKGSEVTPNKGEVVVADVPRPELNKLSDEVLEKYLESQTAAPAETAAAATGNTANAEIDTNDMKDMLADVSDEDLQQYLDKYSNTKDIITN